MKINSLKSQYIIYSLFVILLLIDIGYSCVQFYNVPLDGDMAESIVPISAMEKTMKDPLGIKTVIEKEYHHNPNRFFSHWIFQKTFRWGPEFLQNFTNPINSVYGTCMLTKIFMQILLIILFCWSIKGSTKIFNKDFILLALLMTPFFQTYGYRKYVGLIDTSISYNFFYALSCIFVIAYFLPLLFELFHGKEMKIHWLIKLFWIPLALLVCFSGPLNPGIVLIASLMIVLQKVWNNYFTAGDRHFFQKLKTAINLIPKNYYFYLIPVCILSLYSLYVGTYNSAKFWDKMPLSELYSRLPKGLYDMFFEDGWCFLYLGIVLAVNIVLLNVKYRTPKGKKILNAFIWVSIFSLIYILLLPLGGYRNYRPNVIRSDTFMPVIICLIFLFGVSTFYLIKEISNRNKIWYYPIIAIFLFLYTKADNHMGIGENRCERQNLMTIAQSKEDVVCLPNDCHAATWGPISKPEDSRDYGKLLYIWKITDKPKLFYNEFEKE